VYIFAAMLHHAETNGDALTRRLFCYSTFMRYYLHVASVIFLNNDGKFILQKRDDKPEIRNPGMITAWGGAVECSESHIQAAVREIREETNLRPGESDFEHFHDYKREYQIDGKQVINHVYLLRNINEDLLKIYEGQGFVVVDPKFEQENPLHTELTKEIIMDYNSSS
jgi:8-oxo-dGTP diphosphatase